MRFRTICRPPCARVEERVVLEEPEEDSKDDRYPDVRVIEFRPDSGWPRRAEGTALAEPIILVAETEPLTETYLEIIDVGSGNKVVTILEVLSQTNKTRVGMNAYRRNSARYAIQTRVWSRSICCAVASTSWRFL